MPKVLTTASTIVCPHQGTVQPKPSQSKLKVDDQQVLVQGDLDSASITGCITPNAPAATPPTKPCQVVLSVINGTATMLKPDGKPALLETVTGTTDGLPPAGAVFSVQDAGQSKLESM